MVQRLKQKISTGLRHETGQSLIELAFLLPVLLIILSVALEGGWSIYQRISLEHLADAVAQSSDQTTTDGEVEHYINQYFSEYDTGALDVRLNFAVNRIHYDEYIYRSDEDSHWKVPMYYDKAIVTTKATYDMTYLTPWGKLMFGTSGNKLRLKATGVAVRIIGNDHI